MGYLGSQSVRLSLWKLRYLSLDPLFFSQVKADLCNNLHSLIIIFFFFSQGRFFGGGWVSKKGGRADAGQIPTGCLCSVKRMFRCSTSDDLTNDTSYMAALSEADALITFLVGHSLHRLMMIFIIIGSGDK